MMIIAFALAAVVSCHPVAPSQGGVPIPGMQFPSGKGEIVWYAAQIESLRTRDAEGEARAAVARGDCHLLGVSGYSLLYPGYFGFTPYKYGLYRFPGTSDAIGSHEQGEYQSAATRFAERYNRVVLAAVDAQPPTASDAADIRAARAAQNNGLAQKDLFGIESFWTDDITVTTGLGRILHGRSAYRAAFDSSAGSVYLRTTTDVQMSARWPVAFETGTWTMRVRSKNAPPAASGRYSAQWVRQGGRWLIHSEVFVALACTGDYCQKTLATSPPAAHQ